jgi:hypothetical protein
VTLVFILTRALNWLERHLNKDRERPVSSVAGVQPAKA